VLSQPIGNLLDDNTVCLTPVAPLGLLGRVTWEVMASLFARTGGGVTGPLRGGTGIVSIDGDEKSVGEP
jgi:hypothetical protein